MLILFAHEVSKRVPVSENLASNRRASSSLECYLLTR